MVLMHSFWQLADRTLYLCILRVPTLKKVCKLALMVSCLLVLQLADCADCTVCFRTAALIERNLATMQAMKRLVSAPNFSAAVLSCRAFLTLVVEAHSVAECAVPMGAPSLIDTTLNGVHEMGCLLQWYAPDW